MICYEVLKSLDISYRNKSETIDGYTNINSFHLDVGDFIFLEEGYWGRVEVKDVYSGSKLSSDYIKTHILKKILYKATKMKRVDGDIDFYIDFYKVWEEEDNINLFNPLINRTLTIEEALECKIISESTAWKREMKLNELLK